MKKVSGKCRQALSAILAAAMILTSVPGADMTAMAAEQTSEMAAVDDAASTDAAEEETEAADGGEDGQTAATDESGTSGESVQENAGEQDGNTDDEASDGKKDEGSTEDASDEEQNGEAATDESGDGKEAGEQDEDGTAEGEETAGEESETDASEEADHTADEEEGETVESMEAPMVLLSVSGNTIADGSSVAYGEIVVMSIEEAEGVTCYYTTNGDTPSAQSTQYTETVSLTSGNEAGETVIIKAVAVKDAQISDVTEVSVVFEAKTPDAPVVTVMSGEQSLSDGAEVANNAQVRVTLTTAEEDKTLYYTTDGTEPTSEASLYSESFVLYTGKPEGEAKTVKAVAYDAQTQKLSEVTTFCISWKAAESISVKTLSANTVSGNTVSENTVEIMVYGNLSLTDIAVTSNKKDQPAYVPDPDHEEQGIITAAKDSKLTITITAKNGCGLNAVSSGTSEETMKPQKVKNGKCTFTVKAAEGLRVSIQAKEIITGFTVTDENEIGLIPTKNEYSISRGNTYTITGTMGADDHAVSFAKAEIKKVNGKKETAYEGESKAEVGEDKQSIRLTVGTDLAGATIRVHAYVGEIKNDAGEVTGYQSDSVLTFKAAPALTKVTVAGVKNGKLAQEMGLEKSYKLTLNPKNTQDEIGVAWCSPEGEENARGCVDDVFVENGMLWIRSGAENGDVQVILYNENSVNARKGTVKASDESTFKEGEILARFTLTTTMPAWTKKAPTVKLKKASDRELFLSVASPAAKYDDNRRYIEVEYSGKTVTGKEITGKEYCYDPTDEIIMQVLPESELSNGKGYAANFKVKARIVWMKKGERPTSENPPTEQNTVCMSEYCKEVTMSTKNPYYADKISLKKKTTTLYSGQEEVAVAEIDFGKNTTYYDASAEVVSTPYGAVDPYVGFVDVITELYVDNGIVYVSAVGDNEGDRMRVPCLLPALP